MDSNIIFPRAVSHRDDAPLRRWLDWHRRIYALVADRRLRPDTRDYLAGQLCGMGTRSDAECAIDELEMDWPSEDGMALVERIERRRIRP